MTWNYRLIRLNDKWLPRIAEVYYDENDVPEYYSITTYFYDIWFDIFTPLKDIFSRPPIKESDFWE